MVLIELFDVATSENITGFLTLKPSTVHFVGDNDKIKKYVDIYRRLAERNGIKDIEIASRNVSRNNFNRIVDVLSTIIDSELEKDSEAEIVIDLCGGEDLALVAAGIIHAKYGDKIKLHRFNVNTGRTNDCDSGAVISDDFRADILIDEYVSLCGGKVEYYEINGHGTVLYDLTGEFESDLCKMWNVCKQNFAIWNEYTSNMGYLTGLAHLKDGLSLSFNREEVKYFLKGHNRFCGKFLRNLCNNKLINNLTEENGIISFDFKNPLIKHCLVQSGQVLELYIAYLAKTATDSSGNPIFSDALTGVHLDWDGQDPKEAYRDVENEIDVLLMKGITPVFISCKNGTFEGEEFYKLCAVANRFGGRYAKKVIVSPYLTITPNQKESIRKKKKSLISRARQMGIGVIDSTCLTDDARFIDALMKLF